MRRNTGRWMMRTALLGALSMAVVLASGNQTVGAAVTVQNLGLAYSHLNLAVDGRRAVFGVYEYWNGNIDLNGDGDTTDLVLHVHDASTNTTTNLGIALRTPQNQGKPKTPMIFPKQIDS